MDIRELLSRLRAHSPFDGNESEALSRVIEFVSREPRCFDRENFAGHITASTWIVDLDRTRTLLVLHRKLGRWIQPGGHCDGDPDPLAVALREAREETGLAHVRQVEPSIFDVDVHCIPVRLHEPAHIHYDLRFLVEADPDSAITVSSESAGAAWFSLRGLSGIGADPSVLRLADKTPPPPALRRL